MFLFYVVLGLDLLIDYYKSGSNGLVCALRACVKDQLPPVESLSSGINNLLHRATDEGQCMRFICL